MRIIGQTKVTQGVAGFCKAVALATKGILDLLPIGAETQRSYGQDIGYTLLITGRKVLPYKVEFKIVGKKFSDIELIYQLAGKKVHEAVFVKDILGKKETPYYADKNFSGKRLTGYRSDLSVDGQKELEIKLDTIFDGLIAIDFKKDFEVSSQKLFPQNLACGVQGEKELQVAYSKDIKGKKDVTPIIVALSD